MQHLNKTLRGTKKFYKYKKLLINEKARRLEKQIKRECPFKTKKEELKNKRYQKLKTAHTRKTLAALLDLFNDFAYYMYVIVAV